MLHYNTVKYRLERLESVLGSFVDVPERRLTLELATHVGRLLVSGQRAEKSLYSVGDAVG